MGSYNQITVRQGKITIGGQVRTVGRISVPVDGLGSGTVVRDLDAVHHIIVIDRSGSMLRAIVDLVEDVKKSIEVMSSNDYLSVLWFSGEGQHKVLLQCAKCDATLFPLLDKLKSTIGSTCFSEVLGDIGDIIDTLEVLCPISVTFFTDGCPVVPWGEAAERLRILKIIGTWASRIVALNCIGYGDNYNVDLLKEMSDMTEFGVTTHISAISHFHEIFTHNYRRVVDLIPAVAKVCAVGADIVYLGKSNIKGERETMSLSLLERASNVFYIIKDDDGSLSFSVNDVDYTLDGVPAISSASMIRAQYAYAYTSYYGGRSDISFDILTALRDKYLIDKSLVSFTLNECASLQEDIRKAVFYKDMRWRDGHCAESYVPAPDALCLLDIFNILLSSASSRYVYSSTYKRIGLKVEDSFNLFKRTLAEVTTPFSSLTFNQKRLNISITSVVPGEVELNPRQAQRVGLPTLFPSVRFHAQTLVLDGVPNMDTAVFLVDSATLKTLESRGCVFSEIDGELHLDVDGIPLHRILINLKAHPVMNRACIEASDFDSILSNTLEITKLGAAQKCLNALIASYEAVRGIVSGKIAAYTSEQIDVLSDHGIGKDLSYVGVNRVTNTENVDEYFVRELEFDIQGYSSFPALSAVFTAVAKGKTLTPPQRVIYDYLHSVESLTGVSLLSDSALEFKSLSDADGVVFYSRLKSLLADVQSRLRALRFDMCKMKLACILTGARFKGVGEADAKGNLLYTNGAYTLVIKLKRVSVKCTASNVTGVSA